MADGEDQFMELRAEMQAFNRLLGKTLAGIEQDRIARLLEHPGAI